MKQTLQSTIIGLPIFEKIRIYMHYYITHLGLKRNFILEGGSFYYLWDDVGVVSFEDFFNDEICDRGDMWDKNGFAERYYFKSFIAYDWILKFSDELKIKNLVKNGK